MPVTAPPATRSRVAPVRLLLAALAMLVASAVAAGTGLVHPGIVLHPAEDLVYASDRSGTVHALALTDGASRWQTPFPALPLGMLGDALIALGAPEERGQTTVLALDPASGEIRHRRVVDLEPEVVAQFMPLPRRQFEVHAVEAGRALEIHWTYRRQPLRGALLADVDGRPIVETPESREFHGRVVVRLDDEGLVATAGQGEAVPFGARAPEPDARIAGEDGAQWLATDGEVIAVVRETAHRELGLMYRFDLRTGAGDAIGHFESPYAWVPFIARDGLVLYRIDPVMIESPTSGRIAHGSRLVAHDLSTNDPRWSFDVLERRYFGPLPP